jgi:hypothetical protein
MLAAARRLRAAVQQLRPALALRGDSGEVIPAFLLRALSGGRRRSSSATARSPATSCSSATAPRRLARIAESDALIGEVVNLGYGEELAIGTLAQTVLDVVGRTDLAPEFVEPAPGRRAAAVGGHHQAARDHRLRAEGRPRPRASPRTLVYFEEALPGVA